MSTVYSSTKFDEYLSFRFTRKIRFLLFGRFMSTTRILFRLFITRFVCLTCRSIRRIAIITSRSGNAIGVRWHLLRSVFNFRIRVINQFIRCRRVRQFRRGLCRNRTYTLSAKGRLSLLRKLFKTARRRNARRITCLITSFPFYRVISNLRCNRILVRR